MKTVGAVELVQLLDGLDRVGVDRERLCRAARIQPERLADPESRSTRGIASRRSSRKPRARPATR